MAVCKYCYEKTYFNCFISIISYFSYHKNQYLGIVINPSKIQGTVPCSIPCSNAWDGSLFDPIHAFFNSISLTDSKINTEFTVLL